jgi:hypothetical protein
MEPMPYKNLMGKPIGHYQGEGGGKDPLGADAPPLNPKTLFTQGTRVPMTITASVSLLFFETLFFNML